MIVLLLLAAVSFIITYFSQSLPVPIKIVNYVFLGIAVILLVVPLGPIGPLWR